MAHTHHKKTAALVTLTAFVVVALSGCMSAEAQASSLYVKDALTDDVKEVHVTFTEVQVLPAGTPDWLTVHRGERSIDLLSLSAPEAREKLADLQIQPGSYDGLRIATSKAHVVLDNGTTVDLVVAGNVISLAESFQVGSGGGLDILVDFDLERSVDMDGRTYAATVKEMRTSGQDIDNDGESDFEDLDDPGVPEPAQQRHNGFGLCTAWHNTSTARDNDNSTVANSTAFANLSAMAADQNQTIDEYCATQEFPGPPEAIPEKARAYHDAAMERREARQGNADQAGQNPGGAQRGNQTSGNQTQPSGQQDAQGQDGRGQSNKTRPSGPPA